MQELGAWNPLTVGEVASILEPFASPWWIAGGVGLDLFIDEQTRNHGDIDITIFRDDLTGLAQVLDGWQLWSAKDGILTRWGPQDSITANSLWARPTSSTRWELEIVLSDRVRTRQGEHQWWVYRRDNQIMRPVHDLGWYSDAIPVLHPEIILLFKAAAPRPHDHDDLANCLPALSPAQRSWLREAIALAHPQSPWRGQV